MKIALIILYVALQVYAGYFAEYRDIEDLCNQLSHVVIFMALLAAIWNEKAARIVTITILILNTGELIDEFRKGNYSGLKAHDFIFPIATVLIALFILWKTLKKKL